MFRSPQFCHPDRSRSSPSDDPWSREPALSEVEGDSVFNVRSVPQSTEIYQELLAMLLRFRKLTFFLVFVALYCVVSVAQAPAPAHRPTSTPYTGDPSIFDSPGRADRLQIKRVMDILGIAPGKSVADIGAGSGFFTVLAARRVGEKGMVYAIDIN